jgi:hypothetical protein
VYFLLISSFSGVSASDDPVLLQLRSNGSLELYTETSSPVVIEEGFQTMPAMKEAALDAHNRYRCMHGVPNLVWDEKIAKSAFEWARKGVFKHSTALSRIYVAEGGKTSKKAQYKGENLWMCTKDHTYDEVLKFAVNSWYSEIEFTKEGEAGEDGKGDGGIVAQYAQFVLEENDACRLRRCEVSG